MGAEHIPDAPDEEVNGKRAAPRDAKDGPSVGTPMKIAA